MRPNLRQLRLDRLRPTKGIGAAAHFGLNILLPILVLILVSSNFVALALIVIVLAKWRMFAVRPRFWAANVRANAVDIMVGLSVVLFMTHTSIVGQALWAVAYAVWLLFIKPGNSVQKVSAQAFIGQLAALQALYLIWDNGPVYGLTLATGVICFLCARHFFDAYGEPYARLLSFIWAYFGAALAWLLSHWLLFYSLIAQPTLLLSVIGYGLAGIYYLNHGGKLDKSIRQQVVVAMLAIVLVIIIFSDWSNKVV